ncbi:MAG TPA: hypothetical protein VH560_09210 [Polyangia bacterium]|jgi:hypothetical protein|nr:hypothetical protein [Polyangia bacterium]
MIPYEELDRALARWKARSQNASGDAGRQFEESGPVPSMMEAGAEIDGLPAPPDRTGEIDIGDAESVVETYEEN